MGIRHDAKDKIHDAEEAVREAAEDASERAHATIDRMADGVQRGSARTREAPGAAVDEVDRGVKTTRRRVAAIGRRRIDRTAADALELVRRHPGKSMAICFAAGFFVGAMRRRRAPRG